jgi:hypothetical protein
MPEAIKKLTSSSRRPNARWTKSLDTQLISWARENGSKQSATHYQLFIAGMRSDMRSRARPQTQRRRPAHYYAYALGGRIIGSALELQRAWSRFVGAHSTARVVAIASNSKSELSAEDVVKALSAIVTGEPHS